MSTVVKVDDVSMMFNLSSEKIDSIKEYFVKAIRHELHYQEFWALKKCFVELEKGDSIGIIGLNGSGKKYTAEGCLWHFETDERQSRNNRIYRAVN